MSTHRPRHALPLWRRVLRYWEVGLALALVGLLYLAVRGTTANAATLPANPGALALDWAEAHALGAPYSFGADGPYAYDCSGLVMASFEAADGISLPHNTVDMVDNLGLSAGGWHLVRTWVPQRGDLAFFGPVGDPYHVEFVTDWADTTFGAHTYGDPAGWATYDPAYGYAPSAFYRVVYG